MDPQLKKDLGAFGHVLELNENLILKYSADAGTAFFEPARFEWISTVEQRWREIRCELDALLQKRERIPPFQRVSSLQEALTQDDRWRTYFLRLYGWEVHEARKACPATSATIDLIPGATLAMFSILAPGKEIPPHRGPHKGVLRYHLGLKVPSADVNECGIRVLDERRAWKEGASLVFDDTHDHNAWNNTSGERVVLFVDFSRPLPPVLAAANWAIGKFAQYLSPDVHEGRRNSNRYARDMHRG